MMEAALSMLGGINANASASAIFLEKLKSVDFVSRE